MAITGPGVLIGIAAALAATRAVGAPAQGGRPIPRPARRCALLAATALVACCLPARRAARLDPVATLRGE